MKLPVLVEPVPGKGFVAKVSAPFNWSAEGATAEEAVEKLQAEAAVHARNGVRAAEIDVPMPEYENPILRDSGRLPDDEITRQWWEAVQEYRRQCDADPDRL